MKWRAPGSGTRPGYGLQCLWMGRRAAFLGLAVFLVLVFVVAMALASTHDGCRMIMTRVVCEPGRTLVVPPV